MIRRLSDRPVLLACALLIAGAAGARADIVVLANGRTLCGEVTEEDERFITVRVHGGAVRLPRTAVVSIERQSRADYVAGRAREMLRMGRYDEAIGLLQEAAAPGAGEARGAGLERLLAEAWRAKAGHLLEARCYEAAATALKESFRHSPGPPGPEIREMLAKIEAGAKGVAELVEAGREALDRGDPGGAVEALEAAAAASPEAGAAVLKLLGEAHARKAMSAFRDGRPAAARLHFERAMIVDRSLIQNIGGPYAECALALAAESANRGEAGKAVSGLEVALRFVPDHVEMLALAGRLAESRGDTAAAAGFYARALGRRAAGTSPDAVAALRLELDGKLGRRPDTGRLPAYIPRSLPGASASAGGFSIYESPRFTIYHRDTGLASKCAAELERILSRLLAEMIPDGSPPWISKPAVYLHATREEYVEATGQPEWTGGFSRYVASGVLTSATIHSWASCPRLKGSVLPHELTHLVFAGVMPNREKIPRAIHEGIAIFHETDDRRSQLLALLRSKTGSREYIPLQRLLGMPDYPPDPDLFYAESYALVACLIERKGIAAFLSACRRISGENAGRELAALAGSPDIESLERDMISRLAAGAGTK
ncbi:MAG: hypothetical protein N3A38_12270 [Planctomycetota bacterium]|nr:hypothetical protein [Planctomycetota bacterium]